MDDRSIEIWLERNYPTTIIKDRYNGTYSGAKWIAFPLRFTDVPVGIIGSDDVACDFLEQYEEPYGLGDTPEAALENLVSEMKELTVSITSRYANCTAARYRQLKERQERMAHVLPFNPEDEKVVGRFLKREERLQKYEFLESVDMPGKTISFDLEERTLFKLCILARRSGKTLREYVEDLIREWYLGSEAEHDETAEN